MLKNTLFTLIFIFSTVLCHAQNAMPVLDSTYFVTQWYSKEVAISTLKFNIGSDNEPVDYTWYTSPSGKMGKGSLVVDTMNIGYGTTYSAILFGIEINANKGDTITLWISPKHLKHFYLDVYPTPDLINVLQWGTAEWKSMRNAFNSCQDFNITAKDIPNLSSVLDMSEMFYLCKNLKIVSNINEWNTSKVKEMNKMFYYAQNFNQDISKWNTENVTDMIGMFWGASNFNQDISKWNTKNVTVMHSMFFQAENFNQDIGKWNTCKVTNMFGMLAGAYSFNQDIGKWNTEKVTDMTSMFFDASSFNQDIGKWNTGNVTEMSCMFLRAKKFNQDVGKWNTKNVTNMGSMFSGASNFNQDISKLDISNLKSSDPMEINPSGMELIFNDTGIDCQNYSSTLINWANNPKIPKKISLGAKGMRYTRRAAKARKKLITEKGWIIEGDELSTSPCDKK